MNPQQNWTDTFKYFVTGFRIQISNLKCMSLYSTRPAELVFKSNVKGNCSQSEVQ